MPETMVPKAGYTAEFKLGGSTVGAATDVKLTASRKAVDVSRRSGAGAKEFIPGPLNWKVSGSAIYIHDDAGLLQLLDTGVLKKTALAVSLLDADGYGFTGNAIISSYKENEPVDGAVTAQIELQGSGALTRVTPA